MFLRGQFPKIAILVMRCALRISSVTQDLIFKVLNDNACELVSLTQLFQILSLNQN